MILDYTTLKLIWWVLIGTLLIGFALTDGFDLGVGTLLPFIGRTDDERRVLLNVLGPHWDGNQVWFILAGGAIFAAWPLVYAAAFSGFYVALMLVLAALILRPAAFEYRSKVHADRWRRGWDWALFAASAIPALVFGVAFANLLLGVPFDYDFDLMPHYSGSFFGLLTPFALLGGVISLSMLVMHGATYLQLRTEGELRQRAQMAARVAALIVILAFAAAGIWLAVGIEGYYVVSMPSPDIASTPMMKAVERATGAWLNNFRLHHWILIAPTLGFAGAWGVLLFTMRPRPVLAFLSSALAIVGIILSAGFALFPFIMPSSLDPAVSLTVWDAVSSRHTLGLMLVVTVVLLPLVLAYTAWAYRAMRGKMTVQRVREQPRSLY
jgi:cytochrome d ubiquinol oxidase subunit II